MLYNNRKRHQRIANHIPEMQAILSGGNTLNDADKRRKQLTDELIALRQRVAAFESSQAEQESRYDCLRKSEERYRSIIESNPEPYAEQDLAGSVVYSNHAYLKEMAGSQEEVQGLNYRACMDDRNANIAYAVYHEVYKTGRTIRSSEMESMNRNGEKKHYAVSVSLIRDEEGKPIGFRSLYHDLTERKQIEKALQNSQEILEKLVANIPDMIMRVDLESRILFINERGAQMVGYADAAELIGKNAFSFIVPEERERALLNMQRRFEGKRGQVGPQEYTVTTKDGREVFVETNGDALYNSDGSLYGMVQIVRDVTERKRMEQELRSTLEELETRVQKRTAEIEEANTALRVLLNRRLEDQRHLEERLQLNVNELIIPLINGLKIDNLSERSMNGLTLLEANLKDITSPFLNNLSASYRNLTPKEIQIAGMIREGKNTKEISQLLAISKLTVETHRNKMRSKLGLVKEKTNLRSYLLSIK
jgi:PAS domain S-box-containing protein